MASYTLERYRVVGARGAYKEFICTDLEHVARQF